MIDGLEEEALLDKCIDAALDVSGRPRQLQIIMGRFRKRML
ncbi:hypothetical protein GCM10017621_30130 [Maricaulis virginensis]|uniref:Uncharacterized protein n=1 Tax=Maricaulis virginensis TaxID=144022 RepID=A0A9W6IQR7_9PROT|nr:hypothetical protein GCM10017621_30130 [Maricaulis virginensis]